MSINVGDRRMFDCPKLLLKSRLQAQKMTRQSSTERIP